MLYFLHISRIFYLVISFILLENIPLKKLHQLSLGFLLLGLTSSFWIYGIASMDVLLFWLLLLSFSFMNHPNQRLGVTFFHLSLASFFPIVFSLKPLIDYLNSSENTHLIFGYFSLSLLLTILISRLIKYFFLQRISQKVTEFLGFALFFLMSIYQLRLSYITIQSSQAAHSTPILTVALILLFASVTFSLYTLNNSQKLAIEVQKKIVEKERLLRHLEEIEKQNEDIRQFRHDYLNILTTIDIYLEEQDYQGLLTYYQQSIQPTRTLFATHFSSLSELAYIKDPPLRSIIGTKLLLAQEKGIETKLEITEPIQLPAQLDPLVLVRIVGIFLDNAIEELASLQEGLLDIALFKVDDTLILIIQNKTRKIIEPLHLLKRAGYSTKGANRGLGLSTVNTLVNQEPCLLLETTIKAPFFTQKLTILEK